MVDRERPARPLSGFARTPPLVASEAPSEERSSVIQRSQFVVDRVTAPGDAERAARATLRAQIAKLEHELSSLLADRFPFVAAPGGLASATAAPAAAGPRLPGLGELERTRDGLAARLQELRARAARRTEHERNARELLERMRLEPGRYKYYRVPVRDLGQTGCGVYEVRPRHGLIGMLAGWWQLTLSSGCPLAKGSRLTARPRALLTGQGVALTARPRLYSQARVAPRGATPGSPHTVVRLPIAYASPAVPVSQPRPRPGEASIAASVRR